MTCQRGQALAEVALCLPIVLTLALGSVAVARVADARGGLDAATAAAAQAAARAPAPASAAGAAGGVFEASVAAYGLTAPSLAGAPISGWCPPPEGGGGPPAGVWVCARDRSGAIEVQVGGTVPALVPLLPGRRGLPLHADVTMPKATFG